MRAFAAHNIKERLIKLFDCLHFLNENLTEAEPKEQIELDEHFESTKDSDLAPNRIILNAQINTGDQTSTDWASLE